MEVDPSESRATHLSHRSKVFPLFLNVTDSAIEQIPHNESQP